MTKKDSQKRIPIVVVMGHIDHGKSTLLDYIRRSNVVAQEAGGITQAVSAYQTKEATFIDTPGHAAFRDMRRRGAAIADLAILVVSAEDGVKPQTVEALAAVRESRLPFLVAINKIDRPNAAVERVKQELAEQSVLVEGYGGQVPVAALSAKTGEGVPELLELITLLGEVEGFTADPGAPASGFVLETNLDPRTGVSATLVVKNGTLAVGDWVVAGPALAKVKRLNNFLGRPETALGPSAPAQVIGWSELPPVGAGFRAYRERRKAEQAQATARREAAGEIAPLAAPETGRAAEMEAAVNQVEIPLILKTGQAGALDALEQEVRKTAAETTKWKIVAREVGQISENDVKLAVAVPKTVIIGFQVKPDKSVAELAEQAGIRIITGDIIYKLAEELAALAAAQAPLGEVETAIGRAKLLKIFSRTKNRQVVGGVVLEGKLVEGKPFRVRRREQEISRGKVVGLEQQKVKAKEVAAENQFGALVEAKSELAAGDILELFEAANK